MKTLILFLILFLPFSSQCAEPESIQTKIENALMDCFRQQSTTPLTAIRTQLEKQNKRMSPYWQAYSRLYESIYHLKTNQKDLCISGIEKAENLLEKQSNKTAEDYALLAYIQSFSIQFKNGMEAAKTSATVRTNGEKALQLDSTNIRAWYVLANTDYYTPAAFGGGQKTENYLLKAIGCKMESQSDPWLPSWGKEEAYGLLLHLYLDKGKKEEARKQYEVLKKLYPESYLIGQYAEKFQ